MNNEGQSVMCKMDWQLDGRTEHEKHGSSSDTHATQTGFATSQASTRRLRLYSDDEVFPESYIILLSDNVKKL